MAHAEFLERVGVKGGIDWQRREEIQILWGRPGRLLLNHLHHEGREDLSEIYPEVVKEFHELVQARREADRSRQAESVEIELDERRREELRALGYLE